jgi:pyridoxal phosphate enzyme (YggS family)
VDETSQKQLLIRDNYHKIVDRIVKTARNAGRNPDDIRLVVVTKTQPVQVIQYVIDAGATNLGENYVEEAVPKIQALKLNKTLSWHMIGHVQSRKAQSICEHFQYLHSLDSVRLAEKLSRFAIMLDKSLPVWLEFNVSGEETKSGWNIKVEENWGNILPDIEKILMLKKLTFLGVMTVPPYSTNPEASRLNYQRLRKFQEYIINHFQLTGFNDLSMGMSSDFEVAVQEGSTCVRVGQAILGSRSG